MGVPVTSGKPADVGRLGTSIPKFKSVSPYFTYLLEKSVIFLNMMRYIESCLLCQGHICLGHHHGL